MEFGSWDMGDRQPRNTRNTRKEAGKACLFLFRVFRVFRGSFSLLAILAIALLKPKPNRFCHSDFGIPSDFVICHSDLETAVSNVGDGRLKFEDGSGPSSISHL